MSIEGGISGAVYGWSRDVTEDIAQALLERDATEGDLSEPAKRFVGSVLDTASTLVDRADEVIE